MRSYFEAPNVNAKRQCAMLIFHVLQHGCSICFERFLDPPWLHVSTTSQVVTAATPRCIPRGTWVMLLNS